MIEEKILSLDENNNENEEKLDINKSQIQIPVDTQVSHNITDSLKLATKYISYGAYKAGETVADQISNIDWYNVSRKAEYIRDVGVSTLPISFTENYYPYILGFQFPTKETFKEKHTFEERREMFIKFKKNYPNKIPVILEKASWSNVTLITKNKFLVNETMKVVNFLFMLRKMINIPSSQSIWITCGGLYIRPTMEFGHLYEINKSSDGLLYLQYREENTFG